jgi:hypothetical protein
MAKSLEQQLDDLQKRAAQLRARIEQKEARTASNNRRLDTRRKIIFGGYFLATLRGKPDKLLDYLHRIVADETLREAEKKTLIDWIDELKPKP